MSGTSGVPYLGNTTNIFPTNYLALAFSLAYNGSGYGFGGPTNMQEVIDNTLKPDAQSAVTKVSRITGAMSQADYVYLGLSSPLNSTRVISYRYYGTTGSTISPYNNDLSANLYYLDNSGNWQGGATTIVVPVPVNQWKKITLKMVNLGVTAGAGLTWTVLHANQSTATLSTGEYWAFTEFQMEDRAYATAYTTGSRTATLYTTTTNATLNVTCPIDLGIGGVQVAFGNTANPSSNRQSCTTGMAHTLNTGDGAKTVYMAFRDSLGNTSTDTTDTIILDTTLPTITFTGVTPATNTFVGTMFTGQLDFTELNLGQFIRNRSGASYSMYDSGLVLMYNFDNVANLGESGTVVKDASLYANNGTVVNGATRTGNGKRGGAYNFDGLNDYININNSQSLNIVT